jgi:clan AA aspartic protease (TIGR02281 family)
MTQILVNRSIEIAGLRSATRWSQIAAASALALVVSSPARADMGSFFGGMVGGMIGQTMQQPQPQPYYQTPQYQQPQYYHPDPAAAEARRQAAARAAELKRQKAEQDKAKKEQESANMMPPPGVIGGSGPIDVAMTRKDGNLWVPAKINNVVTIDFVIDSGASDITLPRDVYSTLIRSGTLTKANYIGTTQFGIGDGSEVKGGVKFKLASLQVGDQVLKDVVASVMPSDSATPLLGLSFLSRFQSWSIDNNSGTLKLVPIGAKTPTEGAPTQVAAANPQALPELPAAPGSAPAAPAPQPAVLAQSSPQPLPEPAPVAPPAPGAAPAVPAQPPHAAVAALDAPRSGHVASSALIVKETSTSTAPAAAAETAPVANVPVFPANTPYGNARSSLIALGYGPVALPDAGKCDSNTDLTCFPERAACAKADSVQCDFMWRRGDEVIKVKTVAIPPTVSAVECEVNCGK